MVNYTVLLGLLGDYIAELTKDIVLFGLLRDVLGIWVLWNYI